MKRTAMALGFGLWLAGGCGNDGVEASGFARVQPPEAPVAEAGPVAVEGPAVAADRPVVRPEPSTEPVPLPEEPAPAAGEEVPGSGSPGSGGSAPAAPGGASLADPADPAASATALREARALELLGSGSSAEAARAFSDLIQDALNPGGGGEDQEAIARWVQALERAQARHRWWAQGTWPALETKVQPGEGLIVLRKRVLADHPELLTCTGQIARANQLPNPDSLQPGDTLRIPVEHANVLVDLSARWIFYRFGDEIAAAWPAGVGKPGKETPPGEYKVGLKQERPPWHPRGQPMVPYGDPQNPLGSHWVAWEDENGRPTDIGFHGTSDEAGVGGAVSQGCLRLRNADVAVLHDTLPQGARITVLP